jgi:hypothetical protein
MSMDDAINIVVGLIVVIMIAVGLISMLIGKVVEWFGRVKYYRPTPPVVMSAEPVRQPGRNQFEVAEPVVVRRHQNQPEPLEPAGNEPDHEPLTLQNRQELISHLARLRLPNGEYALAANRIVDAVGGTAADVKAQVSAIRNPQAETPQIQMRGRRLERPARGW